MWTLQFDNRDDFTIGDVPSKGRQYPAWDGDQFTVVGSGEHETVDFADPPSSFSPFSFKSPSSKRNWIRSFRHDLPVLIRKCEGRSPVLSLCLVPEASLFCRAMSIILVA